MGRNLSLTVMAELEEWDDTTDVILWLIEQKIPKINCAVAELQNTPQVTGHYRNFEPLEQQVVTLTGYVNHHKITLSIQAEPWESEDEDGYVILVETTTHTVSKSERWRSLRPRRTRLAAYTIKGVVRKEFEIASSDEATFLEWVKTQTHG